MTRRLWALLIGGALLIGVAAYVFGRIEQGAGAEDQRIMENARSWLAAGKARRSERARLLAAAAYNSAQARTAMAASARNRQSADSAHAALAYAATASDSIPILLKEVRQLRGALDSSQVAYGRLMLARVADSTRADRAEAALSEAEVRMAALLTVAECRMLGLGFLPRCPSRTVSFAVGGVAGLVGGLLVR